ncbi:MAG: hypothetical protein QNM02_11675 [Acidimicrobiia bacterium]|nr:hypothetical protein [Acidimicrobiia bacterium]
MNAEVDARHREEVAQANVAVVRLRLAAKVSATIGALAFIWTLIAMIWGTTPVDEGMLFLAATALGTIVPAAGLMAASYRTSLGAARLERALEGP